MSGAEDPAPAALSGPAWEIVRDLDPAFLSACQELAEVPGRGRFLDPKVRALVGLVVDSAPTRLHVEGMSAHIEQARAAGATDAEIMEALECAATLGIHALNVGIPILLDVLEARGERPAGAPLDERRQGLKDDFTRRRGYWNATWDELLEVAPDMFEAYTRFSSVPWDHGHLTPAVKELLYIAFDASATHLYEVGLRLHIENALRLGARPGEVLEVMEIASLIGLSTVATGARLLRGGPGAR